MATTEEVQRIEREIEAARYAIEKSGANGGGKAEGVYGSLYQSLVRLGARPQLRRKYRSA